MTTIIDHAISIPATHTLVWAQVSNPDYFPRWHTDCKRIAYLTTGHRGRGTRLRCTGASGKAWVMEITAWYEGLGYEYRIVDGTAYEDNRGRIRLQEVAEGTVVQWTFTYTLGGVLGGLRNSMGMKRAIDNQIIDSLRNLYRFIKDNAGDDSVKIVKSLMQDAPDVEQRAKYKPRHPSRYVEPGQRDKTPTPGRQPGMPFHRPIIEEPLITEEDTRPNRKIRTEERPVLPEVPAATLAPADAPFRPPQGKSEKDAAIPTLSSLLSDSSLSEVPAVSPESPTTPPVIARPPEAPAPRRRTTDFNPFETPSASDISSLYRPPAPPEVKPVPPEPAEMKAKSEPVSGPDDSPAVVPEPSAPTTKPPVVTETVQKPPSEPVRPVLDTAKVDTSKISVFEIFGVQKPSETQQMRAVQLAREIKEQLSAPTQTRLSPVVDAAADEESARRAFSAGMPSVGDIDPEVTRKGLRLRQRRNLLALRRPSPKK